MKLLSTNTNSYQDRVAKIIWTNSVVEPLSPLQEDPAKEIFIPKTKVIISACVLLEITC